MALVNKLNSSPQTMSDWDAGSSDDGFAGGGGGGAAAFSDEEDRAAFSDDDDEEEEDETLLELAREKAEAEAQRKAGKPAATFDEIMAARAAKDAAKLLAEKTAEEADRELTPAQQLQRMRDGLKAAEEADNALTNELFGLGGEAEGGGEGGKARREAEKEAEQAALEALTLAASKLVLLEDGDYGALSGALVSKLRANGGEFVGDFLETLLGELTTPQLEAHLTPIGDMLSAAQSSAEAMEAAEAGATTTARAGQDGGGASAGEAGKKTAGGSVAAGKAQLDDKKVGSVYSAFEGLGDDGGGDDDDSDESSDEGDDDGDFM